MLYRYVAPERIDVLASRRIRFTPYNQLNDPFECRFTVDPVPGKEKEAVEDDHNAEWAEVEVWLQYRIGQLGMLCLSRTPRSLLMWSHYATNHRGLVLAFDQGHAFFQKHAYYDEPSYGGKQVLSMPGFGTLRDVAYSQERSNIRFGDSVPLDAFFTKSLDWSYEQEVRIFRHLSEADESEGDYSTGIHLFSLPTGLIRKVIIGANASLELHEQVIDAVISGEQHDIEVEKTRIDRRGYSLRFETLSLH